MDESRRMIPNKVSKEQLDDVKRMLNGPSWNVIKLVLANKATCLAIRGGHAEAEMCEEISLLDAEWLEGIMEEDRVFAPSIRM